MVNPLCLGESTDWPAGEKSVPSFELEEEVSLRLKPCGGRGGGGEGQVGH